MDLCTVTVSGFRRFRSKNTLQTNGKLVALLGPNEAGKSSLLHAIGLLDDDEPPVAGDLSRGSERAEFAIEGRFFLSDDDLEAAKLEGPHWLLVRKDATGKRAYTTSPQAPARDTSERKRILQSLKSATAHPKLISKISEDELTSIAEDWNSIEQILCLDTEDITPDQIAQVGQFVSKITPHISDNLPAYIRNLGETYSSFEKSEKSKNPQEFAIEALSKRVPNIIFFDEESRNLQPEYNIESLKDNIPTALDNLCDIAKLDIDELISAHEAGDTATLTTIEHKINRNLELRFKTDWKQSGVHVSIRFQNEIISIQIVNEKSEFTSLAERSDGLRQFVALLSFAGSRWLDGTILLIDEAEQRLHYDAQADLVQMLARQQLASKVIYTTHSAGCLPEDLGNGVRFARPSEADETRSVIRNQFWAESSPGFTPLLFGMGAGTLAFFPTRNAVMVEGPSDMLLLPTMMRSALEVSVLGFQFVPGLSYADSLLHAPTIGNAAGVLYLVDGDVGGGRLRKRISDLGVNDQNIFTLCNTDGTANEIEDFLHVELLVGGLNRLIGKFHQKVSLISKSTLPTKLRMSAAEKIYKSRTGDKLPKVPLAYEILDLLAEQPGRQILDPRRLNSFKSIATKIENRFKTMSLSPQH